MVKMKLIFTTILMFFIFTSITEAQLFINEIMYNPPEEIGGDKDFEWVEIYNANTTSVNVSRWKLIDSPNGTVHITTIPLGIEISPLGYLLIARNKTAFLEYYNSTGNINCVVVDGNMVLGNTADILALNDGNNVTVDFVNYSSSLGGDGNNKTLCRFPDGGSSFQECYPTPGAANQPSFLEENVRLRVCLDADCSNTVALVSIYYSKLFRIDIENKQKIEGSCERKDNVTVKYNITSLNGTIVKEGIFTKEVGCWVYSNTGEWYPIETGEFVICGEVIDSTVNETDSSDNFACKNIIVVENPIKILSAPSLTNFGSFNFLQVKLNSTYYKYDKIRFLVYGGYGKSGSRIVADLSWNKITKYADCSGDLSVEAELEDNRTYYFFIPFFIYPNCDNYYSTGDYVITLRTCNPNSKGYERYIEFPLNLSITGKNERLCPTPEIRTVYKEKNITTRPIETFHKTYEIISAPDQVRVGEGFQVIVRIENVDNITKNFTAYSYVYSGRKIISEGFTGSRWLKSWTANQREITLVAGNSTILTLLNRIRLDAEPGEYILKVRIKDEEDLVKNITILPILPKVEANLTCEVRNDTLVTIIKNGQLPANFTLVEIQESLERKVINLNESEEVRLSFNLTTKTHLLLLHDERIISNCTAEKPKVKEKPEQQPITGHAVERPNPIFVVLQAIYNWLKSLFFKS